MANVTKKDIRRNMNRFVVFVDCRDGYNIEVDGKKVDISPFVYGAWSMAAYVEGVIDGDHAIDANMGHLVRILVNAAIDEYAACELDPPANGDEEDGYFWAELMEAVTELADELKRVFVPQPKKAGDGDDE